MRASAYFRLHGVEGITHNVPFPGNTEGYPGLGLRSFYCYITEVCSLMYVVRVFRVYWYGNYSNAQRVSK